MVGKLGSTLLAIALQISLQHELRVDNVLKNMLTLKENEYKISLS